LKDERIVAVVVLRQEQTIARSDLIEFCAGKLASFRVPEEIIFEETLPKTSVGKIQKHLIRQALLAAL